MRSGAEYNGVGRLTLWFGIALAVASMLSGLLVLALARHQMEAEVDAWLRGDAIQLMPHGPDTTSAEVRASLDRWRLGHSFSEKGHVLFDRQGRVVSPGQIVMTRPPPGYAEISFHDGVRTRSGRALTLPLGDGAALTVIAHSEIGEATGALLLPAIGASVLAAAVAGMLGSWLFAHAIGRRVSRVQAAADTIARGNLAHRIPLDRLDGLFARQALSLNRMLDRMEALVSSQRQFASHLAHELRTPLTRMRATLTGICEASAADRAILVECANRECAAIIATFDALLRLSEIEAGRHPAGLGRIDLSAVVEDVAETMEPVLADAGGALELGELASAPVLADNALVQQLLLNLLENVVLHTPAGTRARLSVARDDARAEAVLTVADNGPGIAESARARMIEPFARGTEAPSHRGHGLGLAIGQAIARFHGGAIELGDACPGLSIELRLPLAEA